MKQYYDLLNTVLQTGERRGDRTGTGTISRFGEQIRIPLDGDFPLITAKRISPRAVVEELFFFIRGGTNNNELRNKGVEIWTPWAGEDGNLGPIYGAQWRDFGGVDQLAELMRDLRRNPEGRRHYVSAWNPPMLDKMALPPCHVAFQFYVHNDGGLSLRLDQRSADLFVGVPFNIASYALLCALVARDLGLRPRELVMQFGDAHIYLNHVAAVREMLSRPLDLPGPTLRVEGPLPLLELTADNVFFDGYAPMGRLRVEVAV